MVRKMAGANEMIEAVKVVRRKYLEEMQFLVIAIVETAEVLE